ncbi:L-lactate dehydrogenase [Pseudothermotoga thermarum]|uniref:L-lactate dehydrogenase n=1 Tax=Pseudothermotoga thermarum DSM 5069 TaxID=688269 RepID=F7YTY6_9THEM|nr:L-lactate dehydrogenase [Pseudothermotoga thermarum]AEH51568.1 malate dehydrogenase (NAD) [Pseudothermotoga thermarum DSM 5069]
MKLSIYGAGRVGATTAFAILEKRLFDEIVLVDINKSLAEGEAMDLLHSTPFLKRTIIRSGNAEDITGSDVIIITAGASQKEGETRLQLLDRNVGIIQKIADEIKQYSPQSIVINVTNPVDVLTYVLWKRLETDSAKVLGTGTILDTARLRSLIGINCQVSPVSVHAYVIGEHGDSEVVAWSAATIGGVKIKEFCNCCDRKNCLGLEKIEEEVRNAAYEIIKRKGATNYAIAQATANFVESILKDEQRVWTPSVLYEDIYIGYPAIVGRQGVQRIIPLQLSREEEQKFIHSCEIIRNTLRQLKA